MALYKGTPTEFCHKIQQLNSLIALKATCGSYMTLAVWVGGGKSLCQGAAVGPISAAFQKAEGQWCGPQAANLSSEYLILECFGLP